MIIGNDLDDIFKMANKMMKDSQKLFNEKINEVTDEKTREFLRNSLTLAKQGKLDPMVFIQQTKDIITNASRDTAK